MICSDFREHREASSSGHGRERVMDAKNFAFLISRWWRLRPGSRKTPVGDVALIDAVPWISSVVVFSFALVAMSIIPIAPSSDFNALLVASFPNPTDLYDQLVICPPDCPGGYIGRDPLRSIPPLYTVDAPDELTTICPGKPPPSPPEPSWPIPKTEDMHATVPNRRQNPPRGARNTTAGPSDASEAALDAALTWLAAHQRGDGSWSFDHREGACQGRCINPGNLKDARNAATGLALLAFLGAGESHVQGEYQDVVDRGLRFLIASQKRAGETGSWHEAFDKCGNYSHAVATFAVCDALQIAHDPPSPLTPEKPTYEMTGAEWRAWREKLERSKRRPAEAVDKTRLAEAAGAAVNYLAISQHKAGGWRYDSGEAGDTLVTGWVLSALKSGYLAKIRVPTGTVIGASRFLDSVQEGDYGEIYHYMPDKTRPAESLKATTAVGLLCRMYLGWDKNHPGIVEGVGNLAKWRPSTSPDADMCYNYFATQVMYHNGGKAWREWNPVMRDGLVEAQSKVGHERGSWYFPGDEYATGGGRLYATALAAMTLEVYYRYLPMYRDKSVEDDQQ
jgi:hypothetical protein